MEPEYVIEVYSGGAWQEVFYESFVFERGLEWKDYPRLSFEVDNRNGAMRQLCELAVMVRLKRNGVLLYHGVINETTSVVDGKKHRLSVKSDEIHYDAMKRKNTGPSYMWTFKNLEPKKIMKALIGTCFIVQEAFDNKKRLVMNSFYNSAVISDGKLMLSKVLSGDTTLYDDFAQFLSVPLQNSLWSFTMGDISSVEAVITGVDLYNESDEFPYKVSLLLNRDGSDIFTASYSRTGSPTQINLYWPYGCWGDDPKNVLRWLLHLESWSGGTKTPQVDSLTIFAYTGSDVRDVLGTVCISEGTIDDYVSPVNPSSLISVSLGNKSRFDAVEDVIRITKQEPYFTSDGVFHCPNHRGSTLAKTFTVGVDVVLLSRSRERLPMCNMLTLEGSGQVSDNVSLTAVVSRKDDVSRSAYGNIERTYMEKNIVDEATANNRAYVLLQEYKKPQESITCELRQGSDIDYDIGDVVSVSDPTSVTGVSGYVFMDGYGMGQLRITNERREYSVQGGERIVLTFSNRLASLNDVIGAVADSIQNYVGVEQPVAQPTMMSYPEDLDKDHPARIYFWIDGTREVKSIILNVQSDRYRYLTYDGPADYPYYAPCKLYLCLDDYYGDVACELFGIRGSEADSFYLPELEVVGYYKSDGSGRLKPGQNCLFVKGVPTTHNAKGLLRIYVSVRVLYKTG